jgi:hypothetical protein
MGNTDRRRKCVWRRLALYNAKGVLIGGLGVSGDSSCVDHNIARRTRHNLKLDYVPAGVNCAGERISARQQAYIFCSQH